MTIIVSVSLNFVAKLPHLPHVSPQRHLPERINTVFLKEQPFICLLMTLCEDSFGLCA